MGVDEAAIVLHLRVRQYRFVIADRRMPDARFGEDSLPFGARPLDEHLIEQGADARSRRPCLGIVNACQFG